MGILSAPGCVTAGKKQRLEVAKRRGDNGASPELMQRWFAYAATSRPPWLSGTRQWERGMRYKGKGIDVEFDLRIDQSEYEILEAVLTDKRIAMDWIEGDNKFHLLATSSDGGCTYKGHFGCPEPDPAWTMELTRYTAKNKAELLLGQWVQRDSGETGMSVIRLWRDPLPAHPR